MAYLKLQIPRIRFTRYGLTDGRDWRTATGVRVTYKSVAGSTGVVKYDDLIIKAGADGRLLSGIYKLRQRYIFSDGTFVDYSPGGPATDEIFVDGQALQTVMSKNTVVNMDPQVTAVWNYLYSDKLGAYFRVRDYLDLTMSKFNINEFDFIPHSGVTSDDMNRHCTFGLVLGDRYTSDQIIQTATAAATETEVPASTSPTLALSSVSSDVYSQYGLFKITGNVTGYITLLKPALGVSAHRINYLSITARAGQFSYPDTPGATCTTFIEIDGTKYYGSAQALSSASSTTYTETWTTSPATSAEFTESEIDGAYVGFRLVGVDGVDCHVYEGEYSMVVGYNTLENVVVSVDESYNPYTVVVNSSDTELLLDNQVLDTSENVPPSDVIQIVGPHYGRIMCVTKTHVYPSQPNSPSLFKYAYSFRMGDDKTETVLWATILGGSFYVGTTADIYRLDGDFQLLPNDTLNYNRISLGLGNPPVDRAFAVSDDMLVYHAADGYRVLVGNSSTNINNNLDLLVSGYDRQGIGKSSPSVGQHSVAFGSRGMHTTYFKTDYVGFRLNEFVESGVREVTYYMGFISLTAGLSTPATYTPNITTFNVANKEWSYNTYSVDITCLYRASSGRMLAGTRDGKVIQMEYGVGDMDAAIPVVVRTPFLDGGMPVTYKELFELAVIVDTGGSTATYEVYDDISSSAIVSDSASMSGRGILRRNMDGLKARRFQLRITGDFTTLRLYDYNMSMRVVPQHRTYLDTGNIRVGAEEFHWFRQIRLMAIASANFQIDVYFDDVLLYTESLTATVGTAKIYTVDLERGASGRQPRLVIRTATAESTTDVGFEVYWIEWVTRTSGRKNSQPRIRWDNSTNDNVPPE